MLLSKIDEPKAPKDYRPLSIGNTIYKLLMKVMTNRLKPYICDIIFFKQTTFLKGRNITDDILLVGEVVHTHLTQRHIRKDPLC